MDDLPTQRNIVQHINECREERVRLKFELDQFESGKLTIGDAGIGREPPQSPGTLTRILYLKRAIADLSRVIDAFDPNPPPPAV